MSRRRGNPRDPAIRWADAVDHQLILKRTAATMARADWDVLCRYFGLSGEPPATLRQISDRFSLGEKLTQEMFWRAMRSIQGNKAIQAMLADLPGRTKLPRSLQDAGIILCEKHGYTVDEGRQCLICPCSLEKSMTGRPKVYCSAACKQAQFRRLKRLDE